MTPEKTRQQMAETFKCECFDLHVNLICMGHCCTNRCLLRCTNSTTVRSPTHLSSHCQQTLSNDDKTFVLLHHHHHHRHLHLNPLLTRKCWGAPHAPVTSLSPEVWPHTPKTACVFFVHSFVVTSTNPSTLMSPHPLAQFSLSCNGSSCNLFISPQARSTVYVFLCVCARRLLMP